MSSLEKVQSTSARHQHIIAKENKKKKLKLIVNMRKRQKNSVVELDARAIQAQ